MPLTQAEKKKLNAMQREVKRIEKDIRRLIKKAGKELKYQMKKS